MKIIINTHKVGNRAFNRPENAFETRIYATSDVIGEITAIETVDANKYGRDPEYAIHDAIEKFATKIKKEIACGENPGTITITRITTALVRDNKRKMLIWYKDDINEMFNYFVSR